MTGTEQTAAGKSFPSSMEERRRRSVDKSTEDLTVLASRLPSPPVPDVDGYDFSWSFEEDEDDRIYLESVSPEIALWSFLTPERLREMYECAPEPRYPADPFRYDSQWNVILAPGRNSDVVYGSTLTQVMEEYEPYASMLYEWRFSNDASGGTCHGHLFEHALSAMMEDPVSFYIPRGAAHQYSQQEVSVLELVRERLCRDNGEDPVCSIIDALCDEDEESQDNGFAEQQSLRLAELRDDSFRRSEDDERIPEEASRIVGARSDATRDSEDDAS